MKIVIDMNLSPFWVTFFNENGIDAIHWSCVGLATDADTVIFAWARENGHIVFTNDLDFGTILAATNADAPSVFQVRIQNLMPHHIGSKVLIALRQFEEMLLEGALITLDEHRSRVRILPLKG